MKKRLLAWLLALCMVIGMLPVTGATSAAAEVTGDSTSEQALDADITWTEVGNETALNTANKDGVYIKLTDDITLKATLTIAANTTVTLNLNGHKLSSDCTSVIKSIGTLTIVGKGTIEESKSGAYAVWNAGGTVTIGTEDSSDNTDIQVNSTGSYAIYNVTGTMNIYAGTTVWSKSSYTVSNKATLNIYGGMFSNDSAHVIASADSTSANTTISGGTFTAPAAKKAVYLTKGTATVTGGKFSTDPSEYLVAGANVALNSETGLYEVGTLAEEDAEAKIGTEEPYTYYASIAGALNNATDGDTVTLLKDVTRTSTVKITKSVTLNLNNKTIDASNVDEGVTVSASGKTVKIENGTIKAGKQAVYVNTATTKADNGIVNLDRLTLSTGTGDDTGDTGSVAVYQSANVKITNCTLGDAENSDSVCAVYLGYKSSGTITLGENNTVNGTISITNNDIGNVTLKIGAGNYFTSANLFPSDYTLTKKHVTITGGLFNTYIDSYLGDYYQCVANTDADTKSAYPYTVEYVEEGVSRKDFLTMSDAGVSTWRDSFDAAVNSGDKTIIVQKLGTDAPTAALDNYANGALNGLSFTTINCTLTYSGTLTEFLAAHTNDSIDLSNATLTCKDNEVYTGLVIENGKLTAGQLTEATYSNIRAKNYLADGCGVTALFAVGKTSNYSCMADDDLLVNLNATSIKKYNTLKLLKDVTTSIQIQDKSVSCTIDLNGHTWTTSATGYALSIFGDNVDVTLKNGTITAPKADYAIATNGSFSNDTLTLENMTVESPNWALYLPAKDSTTNITDCVITGGQTGIELRAGELNISGDKTVITGNGESAAAKPNGSGTTISGAAIGVSQHTTLNAISVNISGGTFKGYYALYERNVQNTVGEKAEVKMSITGGTFLKSENGTEAVYSQDCTGFITGGTFNTNPYDTYWATGYASMESNSGYFTVLQKQETANRVEEAEDGKLSITTKNNTENATDPYTPSSDTEKEYIANTINDATQSDNVTKFATNTTGVKSDDEIKKALADAIAEENKDDDSAATITADDITTYRVNVQAEPVEVEYSTVVDANDNTNIAIHISKLVYDVKTIATTTVDGNDYTAELNDLDKDVTFRLGVPSDWNGTVEVTHEGDDKPMAYYTIMGSGEEGKYIEVANNQFSMYTLVQVNIEDITGLVAEVRGAYFDDLQEAVDYALLYDAELALLQDATVAEGSEIKIDGTLKVYRGDYIWKAEHTGTVVYVVTPDQTVTATITANNNDRDTETTNVLDVKAGDTITVTVSVDVDYYGATIALKYDTDLLTLKAYDDKTWTVDKKTGECGYTDYNDTIIKAGDIGTFTFTVNTLASGTEYKTTAITIEKASMDAVGKGTASSSEFNKVVTYPTIRIYREYVPSEWYTAPTALTNIDKDGKVEFTGLNQSLLTAGKINDGYTNNAAISYSYVKSGTAGTTNGYKVSDIGTYTVTYTIHATNESLDYLDVTGTFTVTITAPSYTVYEAQDYVKGYTMVYVFTDAADTVYFSYNSANMYEITSLGYTLYSRTDNSVTKYSLVAEEKVADGDPITYTAEDSFKHVYAVLISGSYDAKNLSYTAAAKRGTVTFSAALAEKALLDVNGSNTIGIEDAVAVSATVNRTAEYVEDYMKTVIRADVNKDGRVVVADDAIAIKDYCQPVTSESTDNAENS